MPHKLIRYLLLAIFVSFIIFGFIHPEGIPAAIKNNAWTLTFINQNQEGSANPLSTKSPPATHLHAGLLLAHQALKIEDPDLALTYLTPQLGHEDRLALETFADILFLKNDYANAIVIWKYLGQWYTLEQASRVLRKEGDIENLILAHQSAYDLFPERYAVPLLGSMRTKANQFIEEDQYEDAIDVYQEMLNYFPEESSVYSDLAWSYFFNMQFDQAQQTIEQGKTINDQTPQFLIEAGKIYEEMQLPQEALAAYQQALKLEPELEAAIQGIESLSEPND